MIFLYFLDSFGILLLIIPILILFNYKLNTRFLDHPILLIKQNILVSQIQLINFFDRNLVSFHRICFKL